MNNNILLNKISNDIIVLKGIKIRINDMIDDHDEYQEKINNLRNKIYQNIRSSSPSKSKDFLGALLNEELKTNIDYQDLILKDKQCLYAMRVLKIELEFMEQKINLYNEMLRKDFVDQSVIDSLDSVLSFPNLNITYNELLSEVS